MHDITFQNMLSPVVRLNPVEELAIRHPLDWDSRVLDDARVQVTITNVILMLLRETISPMRTTVCRLIFLSYSCSSGLIT